jgi:hypothetical protein
MPDVQKGSIDDLIGHINSRNNDTPAPIVVPEQKEEVAAPVRQIPKYCLTCNFWHPADDSTECRRKSPTRNLQCEACWPHTNALMACGEWEVAPEDLLAIRKEKYGSH